MAKKLYVGNLSYDATQDQVKTLFSQAGEVQEVTLITDRESGRPKGFGFVEMVSEEAAQEAIKRFNGFSFLNRSLNVTEARPREERPRRENFGDRPRNDNYGSPRPPRENFGGDRPPRDNFMPIPNDPPVFDDRPRRTFNNDRPRKDDWSGGDRRKDDWGSDRRKDGGKRDRRDRY